MKENIDVYATSFTYTGNYVAYVTYLSGGAETSIPISNVP